MELTKIATQNDINRQWVVLDAKDKVFGRLITEVATLLRGKHKPCFTPHIDCGDFVVIINATEAKFTGMKLEDKEYFTHSGYFGSTKSKTLQEMLEKHPEKLYHLAVRGMLPKNKLGRAMLKKLKVYRGNEHPHSAQVSKSSK
ncbi:50S ribosomal protein L13 [Helicobacter magdeburgensis]|uniref:Large ribosomal subunit protein uL13 n=3 Tax=Helicobacter TaxID=209 RepID=A0A4U8T109_9HELI|nr:MULTISPECIES: 50S ribosomal protein L13 [Helicobacter]AWK62138.1 50S ribosomal protein L13 [Helicobacter cinaedi]QOQ95312.1 50S ribosomal protein L13 [Helicobacter cinaedi]TLD92878.1 50S ribosomal protein L13 [Helicobacter magdeburgensis]STP09826.1 50S ribosomal protein L13 [Helicobacter cinaedi]STP10561.1 50S ribosomal protein L13 [Helicobacter cinaedi]